MQLKTKIEQHMLRRRATLPFFSTSSLCNDTPHQKQEIQILALPSPPTQRGFNYQVTVTPLTRHLCRQPLKAEVLYLAFPIYCLKQMKSNRKESTHIEKEDPGPFPFQGSIHIMEPHILYSYYLSLRPTDFPLLYYPECITQGSSCKSKGKKHLESEYSAVVSTVYNRQQHQTVHQCQKWH